LALALSGDFDYSQCGCMVTDTHVLMDAKQQTLGVVVPVISFREATPNDTCTAFHLVAIGN